MGRGTATNGPALAALQSEITSCRACPRLVEWRERVGRERRAAYADHAYWAAPVPGFGDPAARIVVLGLAPAAHGANRTGRMFTGDRSGDFLFASLHRLPAGIATVATYGVVYLLTTRLLGVPEASALLARVARRRAR